MAADSGNMYVCVSRLRQPPWFELALRFAFFAAMAMQTSTSVAAGDAPASGGTTAVSGKPRRNCSTWGGKCNLCEEGKGKEQKGKQSGKEKEDKGNDKGNNKGKILVRPLADKGKDKDKGKGCKGDKPSEGPSQVGCQVQEFLAKLNDSTLPWTSTHDFPKHHQEEAGELGDRLSRLCDPDANDMTELEAERDRVKLLNAFISLWAQMENELYLQRRLAEDKILADKLGNKGGRKCGKGDDGSWYQGSRQGKNQEKGNDDGRWRQRSGWSGASEQVWQRGGWTGGKGDDGRWRQDGHWRQ